MGVMYVPAGHVRPKIIALLQVYGPTEAVAEVVGIQDQMVKSIYEREFPRVTLRIAKKIDEAYKKIPQRRQPSRD